MGLSGAKQKQRIPDDPRNTKWANDTSAPGYKLLSSMGWRPESPSLGLASSQEAIISNGGSTFSKKISAIPMAKDGYTGIGAKRNAGTAFGTSIRSMGSIAVGQFGMGFVTSTSNPDSGAASPSAESVKKSSGGEFGALLQRLNATKAKLLMESAGTAKNSSSAQSLEESQRRPKKRENESKEERKARKEREKKDQKEGEKLSKEERKRKRDEFTDDCENEERRAKKRDTESASLSPLHRPSPVVSSSGVISPIPIESSSTAVAAFLRNPRMAARSKHLRAKRMASSTSNAAAMAEILGIAPDLTRTVLSASAKSSTVEGWPSHLPSSSLPSTPFTDWGSGAGAGKTPLPVSTTSSTLVGRTSSLLTISPPSKEGWPVAPHRSDYPVFQSASRGTGLQATFLAGSITPSPISRDVVKPATETMSSALDKTIKEGVTPSVALDIAKVERRKTRKQKKEKTVKKEKKEKEDKRGKKDKIDKKGNRGKKDKGDEKSEKVKQVKAEKKAKKETKSDDHAKVKTR